jgi:hypothetical protein
MIEAENGYIFSHQAWENLEHIRAQMAATSTPLECDPVKSTYSVSYRLDTEYHLTKEGALLRSNDLADCLLDIIEGRDARAGPIMDAIARVHARISGQIDP